MRKETGRRSAGTTRGAIGALAAELSGAVIAAIVLVVSRTAWSGGIVTIVAARVGRDHVLMRRPGKAAAHAAVIVCLPDLYAALWSIDFCLDAATAVDGLMGTTDLYALGDGTWRLATAIKRHCGSMHLKLDRPTTRGFWSAARRACPGTRHRGAVGLAAARWFLVALALIAARLVLGWDSALRRYALAFWIAQKYVPLPRSWKKRFVFSAKKQSSADGVAERRRHRARSEPAGPRAAGPRPTCQQAGGTE